MKENNLKVFKNPIATAEAFGDHLMDCIAASETYHCALSGGSTPKLLFSYLAEKYLNSPSWEKLHVYWGDERCLPPDHSDSNFKLTDELLLSKVSIPKENIHRVKGEGDPSVEAERYAQELATSLGADMTFDMIILGMGEDGHTASIFPHQMELLNDVKSCAVAMHPISGQQRVTLTGPVINKAKEVVFLVTGAGKKEKLTEIFEHKGDWKSYPASHIRPEKGMLTWYVDEAAS